MSRKSRDRKRRNQKAKRRLQRQLQLQLPSPRKISSAQLFELVKIQSSILSSVLSETKS